MSTTTNPELDLLSRRFHLVATPLGLELSNHHILTPLTYPNEPSTSLTLFSMHLQTSLALLFSTLVPSYFASPLASFDSDSTQLVLNLNLEPDHHLQPLVSGTSYSLKDANPSIKKPYEYKHGELPPTNDTEGWIDPRLNGGRLLDVRALISSSSHIPSFSGIASYVATLYLSYGRSRSH